MTAPNLRHFDYTHLPPYLAAVSKPFHDLAHAMAASMPTNSPEYAADLRHLLEAKDCMVRAAIEDQLT